MKVNKKQDTSEKIMIAAIDLIAERGYNGVSTEEIAKKAGFSEKTLFRHFKSKQNLLEAAFHRYHYGVEMRELFSKELVWDLHIDLIMICQNYHRIMYENRKLVQISSRERDNLPGFQEETHKHPQQLKEFLTEYFKEMYNNGKIIETDIEKQAVAFLYMNYGIAIGRMNEDPILDSIAIESLIENSVSVFARGLTP
ncbi:TetR/AcrR family transcriptional regulator [Halobacillus salinarum]|uniref:TetR/AcrR family transcriptional regulator n=1 Tax=Halobacillus salinarum TaxID=2932257 RepID=A0ABY4EH20_9BACI|nr:TetR/AcrR family transcriptional regulator [Halobacillus salinarum]UOQ43747.1 TetR/AcrR family transcriptional regulator [Halobacillus salinarum]